MSEEKRTSPSGLPSIPGVGPGDPVLAHLDRSIAFFDRQSTGTRPWHFGLRGMQLVSAGVVAVSQVVLNDWWARAIAAAGAALISICHGWDSLHHYGEHYVAWRATAQNLKRERFLFAIAGGGYTAASMADRLKLLAEGVVEIEANEGREWEAKQLAEPGGSIPSQST